MQAIYQGQYGHYVIIDLFHEFKTSQPFIKYNTLLNPWNIFYMKSLSTYLHSQHVPVKTLTKDNSIIIRNNDSFNN